MKGLVIVALTLAAGSVPVRPASDGLCLPPEPPKAITDKKPRSLWVYDQRRIA